MLKRFKFPLFIIILLITQAGCARDGLVDSKKMGLGMNGHTKQSKCQELQTHIGRAFYQVKLVEKDATEKLGKRFDKTERSLLRHPQTLREYTESLDNLAMAVQNYKRQSCS